MVRDAASQGIWKSLAELMLRFTPSEVVSRKAVESTLTNEECRIYASEAEEAQLI
jgi:hypothetical protein